MRKWMRERLQRRKKNTEPEKQPAQAPLQPAYFEAGASEPESESRDAGEQSVAAEHDSSASSAAESESQPERMAAKPAESDASDNEAPSSRPVVAGKSGQPGRTRRRRGGRGRGGRGREQAVAQAFTPAAVKGSAPEDSPESPSSTAEAEPSASQSPKAPVIPEAPQRAPKGIVVLAIGLPGSGKSTWFKRHNIAPLSSDMMRSLLFDDVREQRFQDLVFSNLRSMLKARLIAKRPTNYVDATNLTPQERQHWIKLAKDYGYEVHAVFFDVPLEVCLERHNRRDRVVPEDIMRRMAAKLKPPAFPEGFAKITVVRVKKKEGVEEPALPEE